MPRIGWTKAEAWVRTALATTGFCEVQAEAAAWGLCEAQAAGTTTHGIVRVLQYTASAQAGDVDVTSLPEWVTRDGATSLIDACGGYGYAATRELVDHLCEAVPRHGIAAGGVRNSHHFGPAGLYAVRAARKGYAAIIVSNASANLAGPGATRPVVGNNPVAIAMPGTAEEGPVCADVAMSVVAQGHIRLASQFGKEIPLGWARDTNGSPTTDPDAALAAAMLEPIGGHKGFALAAMFELLAGALTGSPFGTDSAAHTHRAGGVGHLVIVLDPGRYSTTEGMAAAVQRLADQVRSAGSGANESTMPGWPEERRRRRAMEDGLELDRAIIDQLTVLDPVVGWSLEEDLVPGA